MLHATIHTAANHPSAGPPYALDGVEVSTLAMPAAELRPLLVTFEEAAAAIERLPRMFFEPDGSFVWVSARDEAAWQLDGQLQDQGERLDHVELKGTCSAAALAQLLAALRSDGETFVFQLLRAAVIIDEAAAEQLLSPARCA